jgi:hypothetical protein
MTTEKEYTGRTRSLKILFPIVESPFIYTKKRLAEKYGRSYVALPLNLSLYHH